MPLELDLQRTVLERETALSGAPDQPSDNGDDGDDEIEEEGEETESEEASEVKAQEFCNVQHEFCGMCGQLRAPRYLPFCFRCFEIERQMSSKI